MTPQIKIMAGGADIGGTIGGREIEGSIKEHIGEKANVLSLAVSNYPFAPSTPSASR